MHDEVIEDKQLAKTLLKSGVSGLTMCWKPDLGGTEERPIWSAVRQDEQGFIPLMNVPMGVHEILWEKDGSMEQLVFTDKAIFWGSNVYPKGSGISKVVPHELHQLQVYLNGSGMRIIAFGSDEDSMARRYQPYRASEKVPEQFKGHLLLGQVDLNTGDIWPIPKEAR